MTNDGCHRTLDVVNFKADVCGVFDVFLSKCTITGPQQRLNFSVLFGV